MENSKHIHHSILQNNKEMDRTKQERKGTLLMSAYDRHEKQFEDLKGGNSDMYDDLHGLFDNLSLIDKRGMENGLRKILDYFENELNSPDLIRRNILATFHMAMEDREFAMKAGVFYGAIHTMQIGEDSVRLLLIKEIQKELEKNGFCNGIRLRFLNAVFLLSEMHYQIKFDDKPPAMLGGVLLKCFLWLLTGQEKELETLGTCLIVNGIALKKNMPASYRNLMVEIRVTLLTRKLSTTSKTWLLLILDMDNANFGSPPEELLLCYMSFLGDKTFQKFKRLRATHIPSSRMKIGSTNVQPELPRKEQLPSRMHHVQDRQFSCERPPSRVLQRFPDISTSLSKLPFSEDSQPSTSIHSSTRRCSRTNLQFPNHPFKYHFENYQSRSSSNRADLSLSPDIFPRDQMQENIHERD